MTRRSAALAVLCLLLAGCPQEAAETAPTAALAKSADTECDCSKQQAPEPATPPSVVGTTLSGTLSDEWFQGSAGLEGTQLVVFFEIWCPYCRKEVPRLQQLQAAYADQGLQVVGLTRLSRSSSEAKLQAFIDEHGVTYPVGRPRPGLNRELQVSRIPSAAVVQDGTVVWRGHPSRLTDEMVEEWL